MYSRNQILDKIWGNKSEIDDRTVDVHIKRLRGSLKQSGYDKLIQTVVGQAIDFLRNRIINKAIKSRYNKLITQ